MTSIMIPAEKFESEFWNASPIANPVAPRTAANVVVSTPNTLSDISTATTKTA